MEHSENVLIIGSGVAGMEASLMLSKAGKKVTLVEKLSLIGGKTIKNEETYPNMDCSTCLVAPIQQEILQDGNITVLTSSQVTAVSGDAGDFSVKINKKAGYVDLVACLGCGMCYPVCPVEQINEWEENLINMKAIYVPCAGALPNVPVIDADKCLHLNGTDKECNKCVEACMFGAINLVGEDEQLDIDVGAILIATGYDMMDISILTDLGYGKYPGVYTAMEFERLFAANGPTEGNLVMRDGKTVPSSVAIIHCVGRSESHYCSSVCCMASSKHAHFLRHKLKDAKIYNIYSDICLPDKTYQKFYEDVKAHSSQFIYQSDRDKMKITEKNGKLKIEYLDSKEKSAFLDVDMVILANALKPAIGSDELGKVLGINHDKFGFVEAQPFNIGTVVTSKSGVFVAGCAEGPKDIQSSIIQSEAAVAEIMSLLNS
ncbi:MAG: CoB--CoM heterodisulfide reductase iron-sulfur subunit A family protein [Candidatus Cloacimonadota bacterium]|nr:MAG: CoB--CoM heterodisulfide reductase iron-sulfur subunit A family protein [Candidatus Cloacimonadota bacterium]